MEENRTKEKNRNSDFFILNNEERLNDKKIPQILIYGICV
jgi:hypothetical protein